MNAIGYVRASTAEQSDSGLGLTAQRTAIETACAARGWTLLRIEEDIASGAKVDRPGLQRALTSVQTGEANCIVVLRLDRLSRSVKDFSDMLARFPSGIVCLDLGIDPTTPSGEMIVTVVAAMVQMERRLISQRTKEALAVKKAQGIQIGRPRSMDPKIRRRILREYAKGGRGNGYKGIADRLNAQGVPTVLGGSKWYPSTAKRVVESG